jgi:hypothetical protein
MPIVIAVVVRAVTVIRLLVSARRLRCELG